MSRYVILYYSTISNITLYYFSLIHHYKASLLENKKLKIHKLPKFSQSAMILDAMCLYFKIKY